MQSTRARPVEQGVVERDGQRTGQGEPVDDEPGQGQADLVGRPAGLREEPVRPVMRPQRRQARADEHPAHRPPPGRGQHPHDQGPEHPERRRGETRPETLQQHRERNRYRDVREHRRPLFRVGSGSADARLTSPPSRAFTSPPRRAIPPVDTRETALFARSGQPSTQSTHSIPIKDKCESREHRPDLGMPGSWNVDSARRVGHRGFTRAAHLPKSRTEVPVLRPGVLRGDQVRARRSRAVVRVARAHHRARVSRRSTRKQVLSLGTR